MLRIQIGVEFRSRSRARVCLFAAGANRRQDRGLVRSLGSQLFLKLKSSTLTESGGGAPDSRLYGEQPSGLCKNVIVESPLFVFGRNGFKKFHLPYARVVLWEES